MDIPEKTYAEVNDMMKRYAEEAGGEFLRGASGNLTGCIRIGDTEFPYMLSSEGVTIGTKTRSFDELDKLIPTLEELIEKYKA